MGAAKKKKQRFFAEHTQCCFCGGKNPTASIDHVPPRAAFPGRNGPEGFEFPACDDCQKGTRLDEIAFAFMVMISDMNDDNFAPKSLDRLMEGMRNNLPHLLPLKELPASKKRRSMKEMGLPRRPGQTLSEVPVIEYSSEFHDHINRYLAKMMCALFYKEQGRIAPHDYLVWTDWGTYADARSHPLTQAMMNITPETHQGERRNMDIGDRFSYRFNRTDRADISIIAAVGAFGQGVVFHGMIIDPENGAKLDQPFGNLQPISDALNG